MKARGCIQSRMRTADNKKNLAAGFVSSMTETYGGTRLGRQELDGEIMTDHPGALWTRGMIARACRNRKFGHAYRRSDYGKVIMMKQGFALRKAPWKQIGASLLIFYLNLLILIKTLINLLFSIFNFLFNFLKDCHIGVIYMM